MEFLFEYQVDAITMLVQFSPEDSGNDSMRFASIFTDPLVRALLVLLSGWFFEREL